MVDIAGQRAGTESTLSNWIGPYVTDMLGRAESLASQPYTPYTGQLSAGPSDLQTDAFSGYGALNVPQTNMSFDPTTFTSDLSYAPDTFDPTATGVDPFTYSGYGDTGQFDRETWTNPANYTNYMSPYIDQALLPQLEEMRRQADISRLDDATRLTQAGAYGGSRQAIMESELRDNLARLQNETYGTGLQRAYQSGQDQFNTEEAARRQQYNIDREVGLGQNRWENQFKSDRELAEEARYRDQFNIEENRAMQNYQDQIERARQQHNIEQQLEFGNTQANRDYGLNLLTDMLRSGELQRQIESEGIAADIAQFENERDYPYRMVQYMQSMLQNLPLQTHAYPYVQPSGFSDTLGYTSYLSGLLEALFPSGNSTNSTTNSTTTGNTGDPGLDAPFG